jgi:DNA polymerase I-like protein with 3'-5' exonuclease and polymerase domains
MKLALDTEATGVRLRHGDFPFAVSACDEDGQVWYWEWAVDPFTRIPEIRRSDVAAIKRLIAGKHLIFHNASFDIRALALLGIVVTEPYEDTMVAAHACCSGQKLGLKELAELHIDYPSSDEEMLVALVNRCHRICSTAKHWVKRGKKTGIPPTLEGFDPDVVSQYMLADSAKADMWLPRVMFPQDQTCRQYATGDVERTMGLWFFLTQQLKRLSLWQQYHEQMDSLRVTMEMEDVGIHYLEEAAKPQRERLTREIQDASNDLNRLAGKTLNLRSQPQVRDVVYGKFKLPVLVQGKSGPSISVEAIDKITPYATGDSLRFLTRLMDYRGAQKGMDYVDEYDSVALQEDGLWVIHSHFNTARTRGTRLSSNDPNLQNVSKQEHSPLRSLFGPRPGKVWLCCDYNQLEARLMAQLSGDPRLLDVFKNNRDFHAETAGQIYGRKDVSKAERGDGKIVNFAVQYGGGIPALTRKTGDPEKARLFLSAYHQAYPGVKEFGRKQTQECCQCGYVHTLFGYRCWPRNPKDAGNYVDQGTAGQIAKRAMIRCRNWLLAEKIRGYLVLQIHDELVFELDANEPITDIAGSLKRLMEQDPSGVITIPTPVEVSLVHESWDKGVKLELS